MQFLWRDQPISGHAAWRSRIGDKNDQLGRSAPTIAAAWAGPAELYAGSTASSVVWMKKPSARGSPRRLRLVFPALAPGRRGAQLRGGWQTDSS